MLGTSLSHLGNMQYLLIGLPGCYFGCPDILDQLRGYFQAVKLASSNKTRQKTTQYKCFECSILIYQDTELLQQFPCAVFAVRGSKHTWRLILQKASPRSESQVHYSWRQRVLRKSRKGLSRVMLVRGRQA